MKQLVFDSIKSFDEARNLSVGPCNGLTLEERWQKETAGFVDAILRNLKPDAKRVLDYGCGVGRIAKELLRKNQELEVYGVDSSEAHLMYASSYVVGPRFKMMKPEEFNEKVDAAVLVYVLQSVPAIELREVLERIHANLNPDGVLIYCSSNFRMAPRFDQLAFFDDRFLGVNLQNELERFFEPAGNLFTPADYENHPILKQIILARAPDGRRDPGWLTHHAGVYRPRKIEGPYFQVPLVDRPPAE